MKALSIKQPWAWLICAGYKDVENRSWGEDSPLFSIELPCRIYVHAGKTDDMREWVAAWQIVERLHNRADSEILRRNYAQDKSLGAIIGEVTITGCVRDSKSPWAVKGQNHFLLENPVLYEKPVPYQGQLGFFEVELKQ